MNRRTLGKSGLEISEIGLGCWQLGEDFGPLDADRAHDILAAAHDAGIDFWDTADVYGAGKSEARIAEYLRTSGASPVVATKVGRDPSLYPDGYRKDRVRGNIEDSLRRLGVEVIDLIQLHCVPPEVLKAGDMLAWMEDFQQQGLIRHFGASVETLDEARFAVRHPKLTSLQIIFNLFRQNAAQELFPLARRNEVGIIVRLPLASGVLGGKMTKDRVFAETDHRHYNRHGEAFSQGETFSGIPFETAIGYAETLQRWLPAGMSLAGMAMRWILDHDAVTTVIAGASRPEQVRENAGASELPTLSDELHERLAAFYVERIERTIQVEV